MQLTNWRPSWALRSFTCAAMAMFLCICGAHASEYAINGTITGVPVGDILEAYREQGFPLAWSSNLVPGTLLVLSEPSQSEPMAILAEVLQPHGLELKQADGIFLVVRATTEALPADRGSLLVIVRDQNARLITAPISLDVRPALPDPDDLGDGVYQYREARPGRYVLAISGPGFEPVLRTVRIRPATAITIHARLESEPAELETLTVSTSRYVLFSNSQFFIDQRAIQNLPDIGDDPIRSVHRLPGTAAGGWSARSHFRGGEENETAIYLNGLQLLDPFHVRDFHNIFSSIDARTIAGVEAYTGGFPAIYGDRMSGMLLLQSQKPEKPRRHELGISVFNTSLLTSGYSQTGKIDWLFSARRSNLELVLDKQKHGEPSYDDLFAELGINLSPRTRITINAQRANDGVLVITENTSEEQEYSSSDTLNQNFWVQVENQWTPLLYSQTVVSSSSFSNERDAVANDPTQLLGHVIDHRKFDILGLRQDWGYEASDKHFLKWGWEFRHTEARYRYLAQAEYFDFYLAYPGVPDDLERNVSANPRGEGYTLYFSDRWQISPDTTLETGLRWDKQTWLGPASGDQFSPRLNLLHTLSEHTELRLTWGSYYQSQGIHELQVEDGVEHFFPDQQADHLIAGIHFRLPADYSLRLEAFNKDYSDLRPRFENLLDPLPLIAELEPDRVRIAPQSATSRGLELTLEHDSNGSLNWWASYTWSKVSDRIEGHDELRNWDQRHSLQAGLAWQPGDWEIGLAVKLHSGWPTTLAVLIGDDEENYQLVFDPRNDDNLNTFFNLDARLARVWDFENSRLTAFFEISNLSNRKNECCVDYDIESDDEDNDFLERSVDHWLGATPAIGVLWEF